MFALLLAAALPTLFWDRGPETAEALKAASIPCIAATADGAKAWSSASFCVTVVRPEEMEKVPPPGMKWTTRDIGTASATRAPWVDSNGWRFLRHPDRKYVYESSKGAAPLEAAEAFAFGVDALVRAEPEDLKPLGSMLAFLKSAEDASKLAPATNIAVIDTGSPLIPEVINLMVRRNLLCRVVSAPDPSADLNVRIGSPEFPEAAAANPVAVADKARSLLTDKKRLLRIFGAEVVIGRLYMGEGRARIHLLNYGRDNVEGIRVLVRGSYSDVRIAAFGYPGAKPEDLEIKNGMTEFTIPNLGMYAIVDLKSRQ